MKLRWRDTTGAVLIRDDGKRSESHREGGKAEQQFKLAADRRCRSYPSRDQGHSFTDEELESRFTRLENKLDAIGKQLRELFDWEEQEEKPTEDRSRVDEWRGVSEEDHELSRRTRDHNSRNSRVIDSLSKLAKRFRQIWNEPEHAELTPPRVSAAWDTSDAAQQKGLRDLNDYNSKKRW